MVKMKSIPRYERMTRWYDKPLSNVDGPAHLVYTSTEQRLITGAPRENILSRNKGLWCPTATLFHNSILSLYFRSFSAWCTDCSTSCSSRPCTCCSWSTPSPTSTTSPGAPERWETRSIGKLNMHCTCTKYSNIHKVCAYSYLMKRTKYLANQ